MVTSSKPEITLQLHEYSITDGTGQVLQRVKDEDGLEVEVFTEGNELAISRFHEPRCGIKQDDIYLIQVLLLPTWTR